MAAVVGVSSPAFAIHQPDPFSCSWNRTFGSGDFLWLKILQTNPSAPWTPLCFVDAGSAWDLNVRSVVGLHTGNNAGIIGSDTVLWAFPKWHDDFTNYGTVRHLTIYS
ncbi:hypothetical protein FHR83_008760 [Actinoplanes campanulatus]|uniref:Peptidase inhibitor family I36 n=2 Tax=Actinoplanes campanulatus TaxID=113559 RepID=A0A7W5ARR8_9ACTN|nr:hypothetical protein [Actinoplanes campanulatus]MBB3101032.1 hypothetical protein [Actinoplanes campanulatus]